MPAAEEQPSGIGTVLDRFTIYYILIPGMIFHSLILYAFGVVTLQEMLTIKAVPFIAWSSVMSFVWGFSTATDLRNLKPVKGD